MEKWIVLFSLFFSLKAHPFDEDTSLWINIDCGSSTSYRTIDSILWQTDDNFINTGVNKQVSPNTYTTWEQMNSLRAFKQQNKNCYTLPSDSMHRYFIRVMFMYGNYDGLSKAPRFDLEIDGNKIKSIETSVDEMVYTEVIYTSKGDNISVCLTRTRDKEYPFISSLEAWPVLNDMYVGMNRDLAWITSYRYDYGAKDNITGYPGDKHNRMWQPAPQQQDLVPVVADTTRLYYTAYEDPPYSAIFDAVEAQTSTDKIILSFPITKTNSLNYVLMYFTEMSMLQTNETRSFDTYVDDEYAFHTIVQYENCSAGKNYFHPKGTALSVELRPLVDSTLPPIISAIEVYTASDALVTIGTSQDDLDGLRMILKAYFEQLKGWSGEPCLPGYTTWEWLRCFGTDPPRVTSLNLSGYGLDGSIPNFSIMQGLESIDLSNNSLDGHIPDFLGKLPNLKLLDLRANNFSGEIPLSISSNKKIKFSADRNIKSSHHEENKSGLIIGLAVGLTFGILIIAIIAYFFWRKKSKHESGLAIESKPESKPEVQESCQEEGSVSINVSPNSMILAIEENESNRPNPEGGNVRIENISGGNNENITFEGNGNIEENNLSGEDIQVHVGAGEIYGHDSSMVPDMDMDELEELVQQHENTQRTRGTT